METATTQTNKLQLPTSLEVEKEIQRRDQAFWNWLLYALIYYVIVNLFLIAVNWFTSPHYWWALWSIAGWGISLTFTAVEKSMKY